MPSPFVERSRGFADPERPTVHSLVGGPVHPELFAAERSATRTIGDFEFWLRLGLCGHCHTVATPWGSVTEYLSQSPLRLGENREVASVPLAGSQESRLSLGGLRTTAVVQHEVLSPTVFRDALDELLTGSLAEDCELKFAEELPGEGGGSELVVETCDLQPTEEGWVVRTFYADARDRSSVKTQLLVEV